MLDDPNQVRNPLMDRRRRRYARRAGLGAPICVLAAISGAWGGWYIRNQGALTSPFGSPPVTVHENAGTGIASEPVRLAAGDLPRKPAASVGAIAVHRQAWEPLFRVGDAEPVSPVQKVASTAISTASHPVLPQSAPPGSTGAEQARRKPAVARPAKPPPAPPAISAEEQQRMLQRAAAMIQQGDIAGARLLLERLDRVGNGPASYSLAQTYDGVMLVRWGVLGIKPDPQKATHFYQRALDVGVSEARRHLVASARTAKGF